MKQSSDLQALNCTLRIKDHGRTWLGVRGEKNLQLQEPHCKIHQAARPLRAARLRSWAHSRSTGRRESCSKGPALGQQLQGGVTEAPRSHVWVTAPRVQSGRGSGLAGTQLMARLGPGMRARRGRAFSCPRSSTGDQLTPRGPQQQPTTLVAPGVAKPTQPPPSAPPQSSPIPLPPSPKGSGRGDAGTALASRSEMELYQYFYGNLSLFPPPLPLSLECSAHQ